MAKRMIAVAAAVIAAASAFADEPNPAVNVPPLRGVMLPMRTLSGDEFNTLAEWGVSLVRFQIVRRGAESGNRDIPEYLRWIDSKINQIAGEVLPLAAERGIKVAVDLHVTPGERNGDQEPRMFSEPEYADAFIETWRRIATRLRGHPALYGYDLVNEPRQKNPSANGWWTLQSRAAVAIREIDPDTPIIVESNEWDSPETYDRMEPLPLGNVIYEAHMYLPLLYTHQGVKGNARGLVYPDNAKGIDKEWLREKLSPLREFQLRNGVRVYVGEFSAVCWAPGAADYLRDCIAIFNEYGWDWTYHAFREWAGWSVEHEGEDFESLVPSSDNSRKRALIEGLRDRTRQSAK